MTKRKIAVNILLYIALTVLAAITLYPVIYVMTGSLKTPMELFNQPLNLFPKEPTFQNYIESLTSKSDFNIPLMFWNSSYYTVISVIVILINNSLAAYAFARLQFPFKKLIFTIFTSLMFFSVGSITIYPLFQILGFFNLDKNLFGLVILKVFSVGIVNIYLVMGYIKTLPKEIDEAAEIDGCGFFGTFFRVISPLLKPILVTIGLLAFQGTWNEYLMPTLFTLSRPEQRTLIVGLVALKNVSTGSSSWGLMMAGTTISLIPILIAYFFGNKLFISGITNAAVKF